MKLQEALPSAQKVKQKTLENDLLEKFMKNLMCLNGTAFLAKALLLTLVLAVNSSRADEVELFYVDYDEIDKVGLNLPTNYSSGKNEFSVNRSEVYGFLPFELKPDGLGLFIGSAYSQYSTSLKTPDIDKSVNDISIRVESGLFYTHEDDWHLISVLAPTLDYSFDRDHNKALFSFVGGGGIGKRFYRNFEITVGCHYIVGRGRDLIFPLFNLDWQITSRLNLNIDIIEQSELEYSWNSKFRTGLQASLPMESYRVPPIPGSNTGGNTITDLNLDLFKSGLFVEYDIFKGFIAKIETGFVSVLGQNWLDKDGNSVYRNSQEVSDSPLYLNFRLSVVR